MGEEQKDQQTENAPAETPEQALEEEKKRSEEYLTRLKYAQADIENLKKRFAKEMEDVKKYCNEPLIIELLDVVDELEMAVKSGRASNAKSHLMLERPSQSSIHYDEESLARYRPSSSSVANFL